MISREATLHGVADEGTEGLERVHKIGEFLFHHQLLSLKGEFKDS